MENFLLIQQWCHCFVFVSAALFFILKRRDDSKQVFLHMIVLPVL